VRYNDRYNNDVSINAGRSPKSVNYSDDFLKRVIRERPGYYEMRWKDPVRSKKKK
jgi:hypothetical protein